MSILHPTGKKLTMQELLLYWKKATQSSIFFILFGGRANIGSFYPITMGLVRVSSINDGHPII
jgi:hypothetical protein